MVEQWWRSWWWCDHGDDQVFGLRKEEREKKAQGKGEIWYELFGLVIKTLSECDHI